MSMRIFRSARRTTILAFVLALGTTLAAGTALAAATASELDTKSDWTLTRFKQQVTGADELLASAKGVLIIPNVVKGALILGGEYGEGVLRIAGKTVDYYALKSASFGLQIGGQSKDVIILFMTEEALYKFQHSNGFEVGVDGNVAMADIGAGKSLDTQTMKNPIIGFVLDVKGLMADISFKGAKLEKIYPAK
jgi:lipid-binding SYLF domain-containing protein